MSAASQARKRRPKEDLEIIAFERGSYTSYSACGIPYFVGGTFDDGDRLISRTPEEFRSKQDIDVRTRTEVVEIDLEQRRVKARDLEAETDEWFGFDHLMVATGGTPIRPPFPGIDAQGIFGVQVLGDGFAIRDR